VFLRELRLVQELCDGCSYGSVPVLAVRHDRNAVVHSVQFGFLALSPRASIRGVFAHRETDTLRTFTPLQVLRTFCVSLWFSIDEYNVGLYAAVC
jgi:hypothetical protein